MEPSNTKSNSPLIKHLLLFLIPLLIGIVIAKNFFLDNRKSAVKLVGYTNNKKISDNIDSLESKIIILTIKINKIESRIENLNDSLKKISLKRKTRMKK